MVQAVIVGAARTPIGSFQGSLSSLSSTMLGKLVIGAALKRAKVEASHVNEVIMGHVLTAGVGQAPARQAWLNAGLPANVPCTTVNKVCGSGLKAVMMAQQSIALGEADVVVAGGMESMSQAPFLVHGARQGFRMGHQTLADSMLLDGLSNPYDKKPMGLFGDTCASEYSFTRTDQDNYALRSYERALLAQKNGWFNDEIVPVEIEAKGHVTVIAEDEEPKNFKPEKFPLLKPAFSELGTVTAANASKVSDGAAALVVMSEAHARSMGSAILGTILASATFAQAPEKFTTAPVGAIKKALARAKLSVHDVDLFEINEAFSVVAMAAMRDLEIPHEKLNVHGGAVSLGHPIGCSGARILVTLLFAMQQRNAKIGCAGICLGGGEAVAMVVQR